MRVADYIADYIASDDRISNDIFLVSGGGCMHLIDAVRVNPKLQYICNHHEQASAIAAEGYTRLSNKVGVSYVTTGPGGTNAITGVMGAWVDSIPILIISGQVKTEITHCENKCLRQLGDQEINIIDIVKPITKYAVMIKDKKNIKYELDKAVSIALSGRPGPVWIDVPLDIQAASLMLTELCKENFHKEKTDGEIDIDSIKEIYDSLCMAERPVVICGNGVRLSNSIPELKMLVEKMGIPVLTSISGIDLFDSSNNLFFGRPGILGERAANFIIQNSDLLIVLGTKMNLRVVGFNYDTFAREAKKIMVDIDQHELDKKTFIPNVKVNMDLKDFFTSIVPLINDKLKISKWIDYCNRVKNKYPLVLDKHRKQSNYINSYYFAEYLSELLDNESVIVTGNGTAYTSLFQAFKIKEGQRMFANVGCASMGFDLPATIGACVANNKKETICITGDGSIQMNLQELQTIIHYKLPIKILMFNNNGYLSIRNTQSKFFDKGFIGEGPESGVTIPNMIKLTEVYGYKTFQINNHKEMIELLPTVLKTEGPVFCELMLDPLEELEPKAASKQKSDGKMVSSPLEDLYPFLPREEFLTNMIISPIDEEV